MPLAPESKPSPFAVVGPIDIRNAALVVLALFATLLMLDWMQAVLIPLVFSILVSYSLDPVVSALERLKIPRWLGAILLVALFMGLVGYSSYTLRDQALLLMDKIPRAVQTLRSSLHVESSSPGEEGVIEKAQEAAEEIEKATKAADGMGAPSRPGVVKVEIVEPGIKLGEYVWWGSLGVLAFLGQLATVVILVLLFLISGDTYKRKLVKITGPTLSKKKITVQILDDINMQIRRHLVVLVLSGIFVGLGTWGALLWIGLEQAALWGLIAGVASTIPYIGPLLVFAATTIVALVQFGTIIMGLAVGAATLLITSIQGYWLTPWLISRTSSINAVVVFIGLLFWGWLWGPIGLIVATPLLIIIKVCCDHVENLAPLGELMGKRSSED
ncbi:AI-2E family transporter [Nitrosococcus wardiae]|uniref:AI-2E family transporter n=1 Tax=Nitrosococcus wardiae TaxID=1814290 RepID=A0A4P7BZS2_9GAMM|nr:AI-2E family transporter [Nitrosococcus wardiae]QBQ54789.1 AI-2E family transporter [Nitrosococcus wardiae]